MKFKVNIKGFCLGKVLVVYLKKMYGCQVMVEILFNIIQEMMQKVVEDWFECLVMNLDIDFFEEDVEKILVGDVDLFFMMVYDVLLDFDIVDFVGIEIECLVVEIVDSEVEEQVVEIVKNNMLFDVKDGVVVDGDCVIMFYLGKIDGEFFEGGVDENGQLVLGFGQFILGFEDQLIGVFVGDEKVVEVLFLEDYLVEYLVGKVVVFDVVVKEVVVFGEVMIDDEFVKGFGFEFLEKFQEIVCGQIEGQFGQMICQWVKCQLFDKLDEYYFFELLEKFFDFEFDVVWCQVEEDMKCNEKIFEDEDIMEEEVKVEYCKIVECWVCLGLVLFEIGEKNNIQVIDEELQCVFYDWVCQFLG